jgi:hypothetical protein
MDSSQNENILSIKNEMWMKWILKKIVGMSKQNEVSNKKK